MLTTVKKVGPALDLFSSQHPEWGVSEVAAALGMSKSSAHALLTTLDEIGLLQRTPSARYRLGWRLLPLSRTLMQTTGYRTRVSRAMHTAVDRYGQTMHLAALDRGAVVYIERVRSANSRRLPTDSGARLPAHPSAVGKVLLAGRDESLDLDYATAGTLKRYTPNTIVSAARLAAELGQVRASGIAYDREESIQGLCCIGAPVRSSDGAVIAAVSISASAAAFEAEAETYAQVVGEVAAQASL
jgi:IclR family KDG regulon transcriptional repressor